MGFSKLPRSNIPLLIPLKGMSTLVSSFERKSEARLQFSVIERYEKTMSDRGNFEKTTFFIYVALNYYIFVCTLRLLQHPIHNV